MSDAETIICLLLSSLLLIVFGFLNTFRTKKFNNFIEANAKKRKIDFPALKELKAKEELKILKIFGILMFFFGTVFVSISAIYTVFILKH